MACRQASTKDVNGREVIIIDTPGLTDPENSSVDVFSEIIGGLADAADKFPDAEFAVLLVLSLAARVDDKVIASFRELKRVCFGIGMFPQACVVWTHADLLLSSSTTTRKIESTDSTAHTADVAAHAADAAAPAAAATAVVDAPQLINFCGECGRKATSKFCTGCGASLVRQLETSPQPPSPPPAAATAEDVPGAAVSIAVAAAAQGGKAANLGETASVEAASAYAHEQALASYLTGVGEATTAFLGAIKGPNVVISNPPHEVQGAAQAMEATAEATREAERKRAALLRAAASIAGPGALLVAPKRRGKHARRERQLRLALEGRIGRYTYTHINDDGTADVDASSPSAAGVDGAAAQVAAQVAALGEAAKTMGCKKRRTTSSRAVGGLALVGGVLSMMFAMLVMLVGVNASGNVLVGAQSSGWATAGDADGELHGTRSVPVVMQSQPPTRSDDGGGDGTPAAVTSWHDLPGLWNVCKVELWNALDRPPPWERDCDCCFPYCPDGMHCLSQSDGLYLACRGESLGDFLAKLLRDYPLGVVLATLATLLTSAYWTHQQMRVLLEHLGHGSNSEVDEGEEEEEDDDGDDEEQDES